MAALAVTATTAAAAPDLVITSPSVPVSRRVVTFDEARARRVELSFADYASGPVDLYEPGASPDERRRNSCRLAVTASRLVLDTAAASKSKACNELLTPLQASRAFDLAVSVPPPPALPNVMTTVHAVIEYDEPADYDGLEATVLIASKKLSDDTTRLDWATALIPPHVTMNGDKCHVLLEDWYEVSCDVKTHVLGVADKVKAALEARLRQGTKVWLIAPVIDAASAAGAMRRIELALKPPPPEKPKPSPPVTTLEERCESAVPLAKGRDFYFVCVDAFADRRGIVTLRCSANDAKHCERIGELVDPRRRFIIAVWREANAQEHVSMSGDAGVVAYIREAPDSLIKALQKIDQEKDAAPTVSARPEQLWYFDSRKSAKVDLAVKVVRPKPNGDPVEIASFEWKFTVQKYYKLAVRLGLGLTWTPWDRKVGVQTTGNGQHYSAVLEGDGLGLIQSELVVGLSWFPWEVKDQSLDPTLALGLRLGLVDLGTDGRWFRSLMLGVEGALGPDLSVGVFGGVVLNDVPNTGYAPGTLLPSNATSIPTHTGVTAAFGIALNFTPGFLKVAGVAK